MGSYLSIGFKHEKKTNNMEINQVYLLLPEFLHNIVNEYLISIDLVNFFEKFNIKNPTQDLIVFINYFLHFLKRTMSDKSKNYAFVINTSFWDRGLIHPLKKYVEELKEYGILDHDIVVETFKNRAFWDVQYNDDGCETCGYGGTHEKKRCQPDEKIIVVAIYKNTLFQQSSVNNLNEIVYKKNKGAMKSIVIQLNEFNCKKIINGYSGVKKKKQKYIETIFFTGDEYTINNKIIEDLINLHPEDIQQKLRLREHTSNIS
jgi:hypothetical protein